MIALRILLSVGFKRRWGGAESVGRDRHPQSSAIWAIKKVLAENTLCKDEALKLRGTTLIRPPLARQAFSAAANATAQHCNGCARRGLPIAHATQKPCSAYIACSFTPAKNSLRGASSVLSSSLSFGICYHYTRKVGLVNSIYFLPFKRHRFGRYRLGPARSACCRPPSAPRCR